MTVVVERESTASGGRLGERLIRRGLITPQQLQQALEVQSRSSAFLGQILVDLGFVSAGVMGALLAQDFGVPYVDRKSTRLNSSHGYISYAVFCLKKKNEIQ